MSQRSYPRLSIYDFGDHLLQTGDLDPVYIALSRMDWEVGALYRWLLAYWCFYHCGVASFMSEHKGSLFWGAMLDAARNEFPAPPTGERWPRGSERRHFRGEAAVRAVQQLAARFPDPEEAVRWLVHGGNLLAPTTALPFAEVAARAKSLPLFGPWIAFKVADMLDRLGIVPVNFDQAAVFMFDDPTKAALMLWRQHAGLPDTTKPKDEATKARIITNVVDHLSQHFANEGYLAPPLSDRPVGLQEIETILCKWKSHMNGHYPLFKDTNEIRHALAEWARGSETAREMLHYMPEGSNA